MIEFIREKSHAITLDVSLGACLGALYFLLLHADPMNALTGLLPDLALYKLRLADLLKPFVLVCPSLAFTIPIASYLHNVETGRYAFGAYSTMPFISCGLMLLTYAVSRRIGRGLLKDVAINGLAGIMLGIVLSTNIVMIAAMSAPQAVTHLVYVAFGLKCVTKALTFITGSLILIGIQWRKFQ